jgi:ABC-type glycerol-3-phosphate transport system permease component
MKKSSRRSRPSIAAYIVAGLMVVLYGSPLVFLLLGSGQQAGTLPSVSPASVTQFRVDNYVDYFVLYGNGPALYNSLLIALGTTTVIMVLGLPAAYWLSRLPAALSSVILIVVVFLQMVPQASVVIPLYRVLALWGLVGNRWGVILALAGTLLPWALLLLGPYFRAIPKEINEAAAVDGAGGLRQFVGIVLPLTRNGAITIGLLTFMVTWGDFIYSINFLTKSSEYPASASIVGYVNAYSVDWPGLMAASVITAVPILIVFLLFQRRLVQGLSAGSVKG